MAALQRRSNHHGGARTFNQPGHSLLFREEKYRRDDKIARHASRTEPSSFAHIPVLGCCVMAYSKTTFETSRSEQRDGLHHRFYTRRTCSPARWCSILERD